MITSLQHKNSFVLVVAAFSILLGTSVALAQTTSFTYQGRLTDGGTAANGNYDLQFVLFDSLSGGAQVGSTQTLNTVAVSNGVFTVSLDFGANSFNGANRFLEISARPTGGSFTLLTPRQQVTSTPYAIRSANASSADTATNATNATNATTATNATQLGGIAANQYVQTNDSRLSDARSPTPGSSNYIQNSASPQASSNFNISGNGTAGGTLSGGIVNATTQYNIGGSRILSNGGSQNLFAGDGVGTVNTGPQNTFVGESAGASNTAGSSNAFFGKSAGLLNSTGSGNAFFGVGAGVLNTTGIGNVIIGDNAEVGAGNLTNAIAIGHLAQVDASNSLVLGSINGVNSAIADTNVGIGTTAPTARLSVVATGDRARLLHLGTERAWVFRQLGTGAATALELTGDDPNNNNKNFVINTQGNVGIGTTAPLRLLHVNGRARIGTIPLEASNGSVCFLGSTGDLVQCGASSLKWKTNVQPFLNGLDIIRRLRPISFNWKESGQADIGLGAEDVAKVAPSLTFLNSKGEAEGVKYERLNMLLINAIKEQQAQIETLRTQNTALNARLRAVERASRRKVGSARRLR